MERVYQIALYTDTWCDYNPKEQQLSKHYLGLVGHYFKDGQIKHEMLGLKLLKDGKTGEKLAEIIREILASNDINMAKEIEVIGDSGNCIKKTASILNKQHVPCLAHSLNPIVNHCLNNPDITLIIKKIERTTIASMDRPVLIDRKNKTLQIDV